MKAILALIFFTAIGCFVIPDLTRATAQTDKLPWGESSDGIEMSIISTDSAGHNLQVSFQNLSDRDVTLNLGIMLANGKVQLPTDIRLKFIDGQGKERLFEFADKKHSSIAGRVDDYLVPLRVGSVYTLTVKLDQFWCQETKEFEIPLTSGENRLTAQFEGTGARNVNLDMPGIRLMNFWLGKVESNTLVIKR